MSYPTYIGELYFNPVSQEENPKPHKKELAYFLCRLTLDIGRKLRSIRNGFEYVIEGDAASEHDLELTDTLRTCDKCPLNRHNICKKNTTMIGGRVQTHAILNPPALQNLDLELAGLIDFRDTFNYQNVALVSGVNPDFKG